jgi:hypothetical protein
MNTTHPAPTAQRIPDLFTSIKLANQSHDDYLAAIDIDGICDTPEDTRAELDRLRSLDLGDCGRAQVLRVRRMEALEARLETY